MPRHYAKRDYTIVERDIPTEVLRHDDLACTPADTELFYPDSTSLKDIRKAQAICRRCPAAARRDCLTFALKTHQRYGVWGGYTSEERLHLIKHATAGDVTMSELARTLLP